MSSVITSIPRMWLHLVKSNEECVQQVFCLPILRSGKRYNSLAAFLSFVSFSFFLFSSVCSDGEKDQQDKEQGQLLANWKRGTKAINPTTWKMNLPSYDVSKPKRESSQ